MFIKSLNDYYQENHREKDESGNRIFPDFGYSSERVTFRLCLTKNGEFEAIDIISTVMFLPSNVTLDIIRTSSPVASHWFGNEKYLFGSSFKKGFAFLDCPKQLDSFLKLHEEVQNQVKNNSLKLALKFLQSVRNGSFNLTPIWEVYNSTKERGSVVISVDGHLLHEEKDLIKHWDDKVKNHKAAVGVCMITGKKQNLQKLHAKIKIRGGVAGGCSLVSFNNESQVSYQKFGDAPLAFIGARVAFAYSTVLNHFLLSYMNHSELGDSQLVFWTHKQKENFFCRIFQKFFMGFKKEDDTPAELKAAVGALMEGVVPNIIPDDSKFSLAMISPNNGRAYVREFIEQPLREMAVNVAQHCLDMKLINFDGSEIKLPSLYALSYVSVSGNSDERPSSKTCESLLRSVLKGEPYSPSLVYQVLEHTLKPFSEGDSYRRNLQCMFLKANLNRNYRSEGGKEITVALDKNRDSIGYLLGRLLALSNRIQAASFGRSPNKTLEDNFRASLARAPVMVFGDLINKVSAHLAQLRRKNKGLYVVLEKEYNEIFSKLPPNIPKMLDHSQQAEFVLGFQHQYASHFTKNPNKESNNG
jgi:CRISPR-associated protein Csd1